MNESRGPRPLGEKTDEALFAEAQDDGSRAALEELFDRYHARVHHWCARMLGDGDAAEDTVQDIFLRLLVRPIQYRERGSFGAWLYVVTRNTCLNVLRSRRREDDRGDPDLLEEVLISESNPEADAERHHLGALVWAACEEHLSDMETRVLYLRYYWGLRVKEINAHLALDNTSGARTYLATGRRKLRRALAGRLDPRDLDRLAEGEEA